MTRSPHWVADVPDLVWLYRDSACELGVRALPIVAFDAHVPALDLAWLEAFGEPSPPAPSKLVQKAARRQQRVRRALAQLSGLHRRAIDTAYARDLEALGAPELVAEFGRAAALALRAQMVLDGEEHVLVLQIAEAKARGRDVAVHRLALRELRIEQPELAREAAHVLRAAHWAYQDARAAQRADASDELAAAARDGDAQREARLARQAGRRPTPRVRASAWLDEVCDIMRLAAEAFRP